MVEATSTTAQRAASIEHVGYTMRVFMARAVLFQDAVAKRAGLNSTDLQLSSLLMLFGPATPGELAERSGLTAGGAITAAIDRLEQANRRPIKGSPRSPPRHRDSRSRGRARQGRSGVRRGRATLGGLSEHLTDDQIAFADELFTRAAEFNHDETMRLRGEGTRTANLSGALLRRH